MIDGIPGEVEGSETLSSSQDVWLQLSDRVVLQMKRQQARQQLEGSFWEGGEAVLLEVEVSQLRESCGLNTLHWTEMVFKQ